MVLEVLLGHHVAHGVEEPIGRHGQAGWMTTLRARLSAAFLNTSYASSSWSKVKVCVPIFSLGILPLATILSSVGIDTVSTSPMVMLMFWIQRSCIGTSTGVPWTPMLATVPPGRTMAAALSRVSG